MYGEPLPWDASSYRMIAFNDTIPTSITPACSISLLRAVVVCYARTNDSLRAVIFCYIGGANTAMSGPFSSEVRTRQYRQGLNPVY